MTKRKWGKGLKSKLDHKAYNTYLYCVALKRFTTSDLLVALVKALVNGFVHCTLCECTSE